MTPTRLALVTGSSGFIGGHLVRTLLDRGYRVRTLKRPGSIPARTATDGVAKDGLEAFAGDLTVPDLTVAATGVNVVFHLAGLTRAASDAEFLWANAEGTRVAAVGAARAGARLVYVSSLAAAGPGTPDRPRRETDPPAPITAYGRSKLEGEHRVTEVAAERGLDFCIVRPPGVYGPGDKDFLFAFQAAKRGFFPILGDPRRAYTLIHVQDLCDAIVAAGEHETASGKTYFTGHGDTVTWSGILETLARVYERPFRPLPLPDGALEVAAALGETGKVFGRVGLLNKSRARDLRSPGWVCDPGAIGRDLGVVAGTDLETGFRSTAEWYRREGWV